MSAFYDEGFYQCRVTQQAMTKATTGTPQFVLRFTVLESSDGNPVPRQYERSWYRAITEKTMPYFEKDLETLGFTGNSLRQLDPANADHQSFIGKTFEFRCTHESYQGGEPREKWSLALQGGGSRDIEGTPVDSASYRQLDALFSRNRGSSSAPASRQQSRPMTEHGMEITDDDIPF
jgi:hypothetical protein